MDPATPEAPSNDVSTRSSAAASPADAQGVDVEKNIPTSNKPNEAFRTHAAR